MSSSCFYFKNPCSQNRRLTYPFESAFHVYIHLHKILGKEGFINLFSTLIVLFVYVYLHTFAIFSIFLHTFWELLHIYVCIDIELILCTYLHFCMRFSFFCTAGEFSWNYLTALSSIKCEQAFSEVTLTQRNVFSFSRLISKFCFAVIKSKVYSRRKIYKIIKKYEEYKCVIKMWNFLSGRCESSLSVEIYWSQ